MTPGQYLMSLPSIWESNGHPDLASYRDVLQVYPTAFEHCGNDIEQAFVSAMQHFAEKTREEGQEPHQAYVTICETADSHIEPLTRLQLQSLIEESGHSHAFKVVGKDHIIHQTVWESLLAARTVEALHDILVVRVALHAVG